MRKDNTRTARATHFTPGGRTGRPGCWGGATAAGEGGAWIIPGIGAPMTPNWGVMPLVTLLTLSESMTEGETGTGERGGPLRYAGSDMFGFGCGNVNTGSG